MDKTSLILLAVCSVPFLVGMALTFWADHYYNGDK